MNAELGAEVADGIQLSDFTVAEVPGAIEHIRVGARSRADGPLLLSTPTISGVFCHDDAEVGLVLANYLNFLAAFWSGSGHIEGVPDDLVERLVHGMSSAGDLGDLDRELERVLAFRDAGITELALRLGDDPLEALAIIGRHVVPALR